MKTRDHTYTSKTIFWVVASNLILLATCEDVFDASTENLGQQKDDGGPVKDSRVLFSPRMDYEQWKPLGQVDPLKNDPTYDYAPPVLDRVHYWIDPASRKPDPPSPAEKKTEILVLGVSSKKPNTGYATMADNRKDLFDSFLKFVDGPNLGYRARPQYTMPQTYYSAPMYYKNKPEQKEPYTMLVPPPMPTNEHEQNSYQQPVMSSTSTTTPVPYMMSSTTPGAVAIEEANLVYQSSSLSTAGDWKGSDTYATIAESSSQVTWRTPTSNNEMNNTYKTMQQLPTVRAPEKFKDTASYSIIPSMNVVMKPVNKQNSKNMETDIIVVPSEMTHKGQVTYDTLDNTYVSIGKPEANMQTVSGMSVDALTKSPMKQQGHLLNSPLLSSVINPMITPVASHSMFRKPHLPVKKLEMMPMTLQTMQTMQTMLPPPATQHVMHKKPLIHNLLKKEMTSFPVLPTTTNLPPTTTSASSLTTDPLFKHYKQPMEPVRGPMYLIIQGHSKVKTYGPSKQINGIFVQETNEIPTSDDRQTEFPVKHLHELMTDKEVREQWDREKRDFRAGRLQTLKHIVQTGLGSIDFDEANRRSDDDIKETEFVVKYDVSSGGDATSEIYHKGIVESEVAPNRPK